jgi:hypothetical protein
LSALKTGAYLSGGGFRVERLMDESPEFLLECLANCRALLQVLAEIEIEQSNVYILQSSE